ncbi:CoxG family protein [Alicyclobacillus macrosporangiidus]|uniref:CoxG family protein n=1 Tax=Alicyclobacillus macrosporangiidus TaxID=392015 RepID=UPI00049554CE|nr:carbon monoxide dehydrogenase subunit G [Alicyclobacillus macrosporangiidus]MCL6599165.1 carbon monoxide dehydrogenase subunit G [Alicyclobacillus macrosporangiidus]
MQIAGTKDFPTSPIQTFQLLTDPDAIVKAMPGMKSLQAKSDSLYEAEMEVGVAGIKGSYQGTLEMLDVVPGERYRLKVNGEGAMGFMEADVTVRLNELPTGGTQVAYDGEAKVGGVVAGVGQRVLSGVARFLINQFFNGLVKESQRVVGG